MHRSFVETVRAISQKNWGKNYATQEEAIRELGKNGYDVSTAALLEIVRRINQAITALANDQSVNEREDIDEKPQDAKPFPEAKVGDRFYTADLDDGVTVYTVVACVEGGYIRLVSDQSAQWCTDHDRGTVALHWGGNWMHATEAEALREAAESDLRWHGRHVAFAQKVLRAVKEGRDLAEFRDGIDNPED